MTLSIPWWADFNFFFLKRTFRKWRASLIGKWGAFRTNDIYIAGFLQEQYLLQSHANSSLFFSVFFLLSQKKSFRRKVISSYLNLANEKNVMASHACHALQNEAQRALTFFVLSLFVISVK